MSVEIQEDTGQEIVHAAEVEVRVPDHLITETDAVVALVHPIAKIDHYDESVHCTGMFHHQVRSLFPNNKSKIKITEKLIKIFRSIRIRTHHSAAV